MASALLSNRSSRATFLMYHSIADQGPTFLSLGADLFERQLAMLRRLGYKSGKVAELAALIAGERLDAPRVFLTFDDGFADNHAAALPLLEDYGFTGLIFVLPPLLDAGAPFPWPEVSDSVERFPQTMRSMDWGMVDEMITAGTEIGSHTLSHSKLDLLGDEELRQELLDSRRALTERLGECDTLAYPFGDVDARVVAAAGDAGYRYGFAIDPGPALSQPLAISRMPVDFRDDERRFRIKLSAAGRRAYHSRLLPVARSAVGAIRGRLGR